MLKGESINLMALPMLKDPDQPKEPLRSKAARMWKNNNVRKKLAEERRSRVTPDPNADPQVTEVLINEGRRSGRVTRFENKFRRDLRTQMEGQAAQNVELYLKVLEHRKIRLLREKLKRLKAEQSSMEEVSHDQ
jgi:hypothetical protein